MARNTFVKSHALGNDYIVLDPSELTFQLRPEAIRQICDRHRGIGSDGILALAPSSKADVGLRIYNPDGSEAEKSGNGLRILARYLYDHGLVKKPEFTVETPGGIVKVTMHLNSGQVHRITVDMGAATFQSEKIPVTGPPREVVNEYLDVDGQRFTITAVSVGNPHCVVFVPQLEEVDLARLGPLLERHQMFPNRTNVQFAEVKNRERVAILIWERGAGHTMASGSSACAVAAAAVRKGLANRDVTVAMQGGELQISVASDWTIRMSGPAEEVYKGTFSDTFVEALRKALS
ncbi:MAG: diaminopimelate epimerase [Armatimonadetes bacterium]|nr:diaminopimelate epimerase [Armatimonadota bacterium]